MRCSYWRCLSSPLIIHHSPLTIKSFLLKAIGICIPIPFISLALLPPTVFGFPPFGIGIGPPLTPYGFGYLALGFESFFADILGLDDDDGDDDGELPEGCDQICPDKTY